MQLVKTSTNFASKSINSNNDDASLSSRQRINSSTHNNSVRVYRGVPVEIIGVGTTNGFQSASNNTSNNDIQPPRSANNSRADDFSLESTLPNNSTNLTTNKLKPTLKLGENLTEKNYLQIIDNLTSRYGGSSLSDISSTKINNEQQRASDGKLKKVKTPATSTSSTSNAMMSGTEIEDSATTYINNHLNISLDLITNLGLNLDLTWSSSRLAAAASAAVKPVNLKEMERKYRERYMREMSANNKKKELIYANLNAQFHPSNFTSLLHSTSNSSLAHNNNNNQLHKNNLSPRAYSTRTYSTESKSRPSSPTQLRTHSNSSSKLNMPLKTVMREKSFSNKVTNTSASITDPNNTLPAASYVQLVQPISPSLRSQFNGTTKKT